MIGDNQVGHAWFAIGKSMLTDLTYLLVHLMPGDDFQGHLVYLFPRW